MKPDSVLKALGQAKHNADYIAMLIVRKMNESNASQHKYTHTRTACTIEFNNGVTTVMFVIHIDHDRWELEKTKSLSLEEVTNPIRVDQ